ncbi:PAS domain S-box protein [Fischerella sp. PCC 9605]|uniref:PAS domain S-box protein n=1 Tax=Fischerella sp. PCC 9605 TaxID=1173024 RepID=UPI000479639A|nr:PAS domain S-box protein [Fischerella sp. PCC 9605]
MKGISPRIKPHVVAVFTVTSALLLTLLLQPYLKLTIFSMFFAAVAVSAWYGGIIPGFLATALSCLAIGYFFLEPMYSPLVYGVENILQLSVFVLVTTLISSLNSELRSAKQRLEMSVQQLQANQIRFRRFVDANIIGVIIADFNGMIVEANDAFLKMVGYTREDLLCGRVRWRDITPPEYQFLSDRLIAELRTKEVCTPIEKEYISKDGSRVPVLIGGALLPESPSHQQEMIVFTLDISDRKVTELALRKSEERYRAFVEQSSEGIWCFELKVPISLESPEDEQIRLFYQYAYLKDCNDFMAKMYGFARAEEIIGVRLEDFLPSTDQHNIEYLRNFIRSGYRLIDAESHEVDKHGNYKYFLNNLVGVVENGVLVRAWGTQRDITERKRAEEALRQREDQLRLITNAVPVFISYVDAQQRYRFNNKKYEEWYGLSATEFNGKHIKEVVGESVYESIRPHVETVLSGEQVSYETEIPAQDGSKRCVNVSYVPHFNQKGKVEGFVALINDITEHKQAEAALKESEERFRKLAEKVRVIPWEANATTGNFTYVGPQSVEILGYPLSDWYTDNFWAQHIHPEDREWAINFCIDCSRSLDNYEFEYRMLTADGRVVWLYDIVNVVRGKDEPQLLRGLMIDITERKQAEQEREQLLLREQTARAEAETANRMKDEFLATLSHELRTPLNAMLGWTQLLKSRKFDESITAKALETIDRNTKSLRMLIEDVLDVSQIIRGTLHLNLRPVELESVVEAAVEIVRPAAAAKEIQIECNFDSALGVVIADANRLQQVIWNLLANAVKFTPQRGRVDVQVERIDNGVQIRVSDTGEGISPQFLPYVFDRFRQADSSNTRSHGGLGLGLAIVRYLVELHGGTVSAESLGIGQGATFIVNLPMRAVDVDVTSESEQFSVTYEEKIAQNIIPSLKGLRVLIVDDEADARDLVVAILSEYGAEVMAVASAHETLDTLPHFQPHVLISDIGMPQEDGYTLIRKVRSLPQKQWRNIPAVALTAHASPEDRAQALLAGFQLHVPKPVSPIELAVVVANLAGRT